MESAVSVLLLMSSLQRPGNDPAVSVFSTRAFCKLVAAARKERSVLSRAAAVTARRRWHMNSYFHSSTVFRKRRDFQGFFSVRAGALFEKDKPRTRVC